MPSCLLTLLIASIFLVNVRIYAQTAQEVIIADPSVTSRCKGMLEKREELQSIKQKLIGLKKRNQNLLRKIPLEKKSLKNKAENSAKMLARESELNQLKLQNKEDEIIKNGCPGISR